MENFDKDTESENLKDDMEEKSNNKSSESKGSNFLEITSKIKKFTIADDINHEIINSQKTEDKNPENPKNSFKAYSTNSNKNDENSQKNIKIQCYNFNIADILNSHDSIEILKSKKEKIIKSAAILIGGFSIAYGMILTLTSTTKVADNVIFGEGATISAFLILLGTLIIAAPFSQSILNKTFLNKIHTELEVVEGKSESDDDSKKVKDENSNKINKNIFEEDEM